MLTPRAIEELAGKMVACPSMKFLNRRRSIVSGLPEKISTRIPEDDTPIFHVVSIIQACNEHEGGIDELIERMDFFEGGSTPFQQVQECWQKLSNRGIVDPDEKQKLYRLATKFNLDEEALSELYWASLPKGIQALGSATTLHAVLEHLWDMPKQPDEVLPVVEFVERLARRASKIGKLLPARKLKGWINEKASYLGMTRSHLDQMRARMDGETASLPLPPPSLLVELVPDDDNRNKPKTKLYNVYSALWRHEQDILPITPIEYKESPRDLGHISELIDKALAEVIEHIPPKARPLLTVEFFLPIEILSLEVDQWDIMVNHDWGPFKLGQLHPVITRSWDRARDSRLQTYWPTKWSMFQEQIQPPVSSDMIEFVSDPHSEKSEIRNRLVASEERTCVGVLFALSTANVSLLKGILMAGIPVALWSRVCQTERAQPDGVEQTIRALLASDNLSELPRKTMLERLQPKAFVDPGNHLTLLWDDPGKIPPIRDIQSGTQLYTP